MSRKEFNADTFSFWFWRLTFSAWGSSLTWKANLCSNVCLPPISSSSPTHGTHARTGTFPPSFCRFPLPAAGSPRVCDPSRSHWPSLLHRKPSSAPGERGTVSCTHSSGTGDKLTATPLCCDVREAACSNMEPFGVLRCAACYSCFPCSPGNI